MTNKDNILKDVKERMSKVNNRKPMLTIFELGKLRREDHIFKNLLIKQLDNLGMKHEAITFDIELYSKSFIPSHIFKVFHNTINDDKVDGFIFLTDWSKIHDIDRMRFIDISRRNKDVDRFNWMNYKDDFGLDRYPAVVQATIFRMMEDSYKIFGNDHITLRENLQSKKIAIIGKSLNVGIPLASYFLRRDIYVKLIGREDNLVDVCNEHDIIISCAGHRDLLNIMNVNPKNIIFDLGYSEGLDGVMGGDVHDNVWKLGACKYITPPHKGVGGTTIAILIRNLYNSYEESVDNE